MGRRLDAMVKHDVMGAEGLSPAGRMALQGVALRTGEPYSALVERLLIEECGRLLAAYVREHAVPMRGCAA